VDLPVSLDRRSIEKRDFPARLRGYDRAAVDAHLRALADELEARSGTGTVASAAGEQVRAVLAAAEASAAEIVREAEQRARELHEQAAAATRSAETFASHAQQERAERVAATSGAALERLDVLRGELAALLDALGSPAPAAAADASDASSSTTPAVPDEAGARLVALELALSGTARAEAERYLAEHFDVGDRAAQLDDVYAAVGG
jgi:DivIVA domain-containing protein